MPGLYDNTPLGNAQATEVDYSAIKVNGLAAVGVAAAAAFSYYLNIVLVNFSAPAGIYFLTAAAVFLILVFLESLFVKDFGRLSAIFFIEAAALAAPFYGHFSRFIFIGTVITLLFLIWGGWSGKTELQYSTKIRIFRIARSVLPKAVTALSVFIAAGYISVYQDNKVLISRSAFERIVISSEGIVRWYYGDFSFADTFQQAAQKIILRQNSGNLAYQTLTSAQKADLLKKTTEELRQRISVFFDVPVGNEQKLMDILYSGFTKFSLNISQSQKVAALFIFAAVIFLIVRSFGAPFYWLVALAAAAVFEILIALGFAVVLLETKSKEIIVLK